MEDSLNILDYTIYWRSKSETGFIGELFFVKRNISGGSISTPVGRIVGFIEPGTVMHTSFWQILINIRKEIRYDLKSNSTYVFVKSAFKKRDFYLYKLKELNKKITRINPTLPLAIQDALIEGGICNSPYQVEISIENGNTQYYYSNVQVYLD